MDGKYNGRLRVNVLAHRVFASVVVGAVVLVALGLAGIGPLQSLQSRSTSSRSSATRPSKPRKRTSATPTTILFEQRSYGRGECVIWDAKELSASRPTRAVPCTQEHFLEMTSGVDVTPRKFGRFPSPAQWKSVFDRECIPSIVSLLGAPLDPYGRFHADGFTPSDASWADGDRTVWCAVAVTPTSAPPRKGVATPFKGEAKGASQVRLLPVGACGKSDSPYPYSCAKPHNFEITGYVDLTGNVTNLPSEGNNAAWDALVGARCRNVAKAYLGRDPVGEDVASWLYIPSQSWETGRRTLECTIARYRNGKSVATVGSARS